MLTHTPTHTHMCARTSTCQKLGRSPPQKLSQMSPIQDISCTVANRFMYTNARPCAMLAGRELPKGSYPPNTITQQAAAASNLPFRSLHLSDGLKGVGEEEEEQSKVRLNKSTALQPRLGPCLAGAMPCRLAGLQTGAMSC